MILTGMGNGALAKDRLDRMHDVLADYVDRGYLPGAVAAIRRRGEVHVDVVGATAFGGEPMRRDSIFRLTSMTKPLTAVATMMLVEECRLRLDEPVDRLLPELADRRVLTRPDGPLDDTVPAHRPITVRDLLTFRMGLGIVLAPPDAYPILAEVARLGITGFGPPMPAMPYDQDEWLRRLGTLPLMHQPGERWVYNTGSCVLGVLISRVSGQPLETFLRDRVLDPLGMTDTAFSVPATKLDRMTSAYWSDFETDELSLSDPADGKWATPPAFADGGAGLVSTVDDYLAFTEMLANDGTYRGNRLLSRPSVTLMRTNQLTPEQQREAGILLQDDLGWGFGVSVVTARENLASVGSYGWSGGYGTTWESDPTEDVAGILLTQRSFPNDAIADFWTLVYGAIDD